MLCTLTSEWVLCMPLAVGIFLFHSFLFKNLIFWPYVSGHWPVLRRRRPPFNKFFVVFKFFCPFSFFSCLSWKKRKTLKKIILTSDWCTKHQLAGQNTQHLQLSIPFELSFIMDLNRALTYLKVNIQKMLFTSHYLYHHHVKWSHLMEDINLRWNFLQN